MGRRTRKPTSRPRTTFNPRDARPKFLSGTLALILAVVLGIVLGAYSAENSRHSTAAAPQELIGELGVQAAYHGFLVLGMAAWCVPLYALWYAGMYFFSQAYRLTFGRHLTVFLTLPFLSILAALAADTFALADAGKSNHFPFGPGGWIGLTVYGETLHTAIGLLPTAVIFGTLLIASWIYLFHDNLGTLLWESSKRFQVWNQARSARAAERREERARHREVREAEEAARQSRTARAEARAKTTSAVAPEKARGPIPPVPDGSVSTRPGFFARLFGRRSPSAEELALKDDAAPSPANDPSVQATTSGSPDILDAPPPPAAKRPLPPAAARYLNPGKKEEPANTAGETKSGKDTAQAGGSSSPGTTTGGLKIIQASAPRKVEETGPVVLGDYKFPPRSLLVQPPEAPVEDSSEAHQEVAEQLVRTLGEFGVKVTMGEVHAGPVITRYDVYPAPGVRVEKIVNLDKNIALGLKAMSVRILAPVPGRGCVGIEVPNRNASPVFMRDILESEDWFKSKAEIPIALGKEVSGKPLVADLTKMPHLLIAGSTGSGKTVCINSVICSLLYKKSPEDVRFVMVDPKIVEMQMYNDLPHMLIPVVTDPKKVPNALKYLLNEMEHRYRVFAKVGVRNIAGFNAKIEKNKEAQQLAAEMDAALSPEERAAASQVDMSLEDDLAIPEKKLPYIIAIVDELADLMMVAPQDIETGIARLAQLARAAGIHLILATQRPSVNVITGVIKANLPSRIAFKVASKVDSRTILDGSGADQLIGKGDMLFLPPGSADLIRSQGAFASDEEINSIVEWIREHNGEPVFDDEFQRKVEEVEGTEEEPEEDDVLSDEDGPLIKKALQVIKTSKRASTSNLQRKLRIGYNRAARVMDKLEDMGIVGPDNGSSPRELLVDPESL